ncbi:MAG: hypothetical protein M1133_02625 [Armatimonadetes bacterium]|nr:hypothetical protein [Armatimonadota bacterium]
MSLNFASQSRISFDPDRCRKAGITDILVTPFQVNAESFQDVDTFRKNLRFLKQKADDIKSDWPEARVIINMFTICHPEGNFRVPDRFRPQLDIRGQVRPGFVCFLDEQRQSELLQMYRLIAEEGFGHVMIDDDFRDAFCFCDHHISAFTPFHGVSRNDLATIFEDENPSFEIIQLRRQWLDFKKEGLFLFARKVESTLHGVNPDLRVGICISAKRCNDLSGRGVREWLDIFDTNRAPMFVRLAGEHYDDCTIDISRSIGWHQYYRDLLPLGTDAMGEVTYVYPIYFKSPTSIRLETKIHLASGLDKVLLAWTDDYKYNNAWKMLLDEKKFFDRIKSISNRVSGGAGISIFAPENAAEFTPLDKVSGTDPVRAYQGLACMGLPVRMRDRIDSASKVIVLTGYLPDDIAPDVDAYLDKGGLLIIDALAARSFSRVMPDEYVGYDVHGQVAGLRAERVIATGEMIDELAGFPHSSTYHLEPRDTAHANVNVVSELITVDGDRAGAGVITYHCRRGRIAVLAYDLCQVNYRIASDSYRRLMSCIFAESKYEPEVHLSGSLFVQPILYTVPRQRLILANYNCCESEVACGGNWLRETRSLVDAVAGEPCSADSVRIPPLDIRILELPGKTGAGSDD